MKEKNGLAKALVLLWTCGASLRLTMLAVPPVLPLIQRDLKLSGTDIGLLSGLPVICLALVATPGSALVSRAGVRSALLIGLSLTAIGAALRGFASDIAALYLTSVVMSSGIAIVQPTMAAAVRAWMPARPAFATAVYTNGLLAGEIIPVAAMIPLVLPWAGGWRAALAAWALPVMGTVVLVTTLVSRSSSGAAPDRPMRWLPELGRTLNWRIGLMLGSISSTYFCVNGFLPAYLSENKHPELISAALTALNLGQIPPSLLLLVTADKVQGRRWPYVLCGILFIVCVIGILTTASYWTVFWSALIGATCGGALALGLTLPPLLCRSPDDVAHVSAAAFAISYSFAMLTSYLSGAIWDLVGNVHAILLPILLATLPLSVLAPSLVFRKR